MDLGVLQKMAEVAAAAHTPLLSAASPQLFGLGSFTDLPLPRDLHKIFQSADYIEWRSFREKDDSRYVTLCLPHLLMRLPYGNDTDPVETFVYEEDVAGPSPDRYLWGNAAFALADRFRLRVQVVAHTGTESEQHAAQQQVVYRFAFHPFQSSV